MLYDIQLPAIKALKEEGNRAVFTVEPLYPGYGMTLGNSLRRVILSSLGGAAVTAVKIDSVAHEFSTIKGVKEDVVEVILNLKKLRFKVYSDEPQYLILTKKGSGEVTGADIKTNADVEIVNPEQHIATIDAPSTQVGMEIKVEKGRGYIPVEAREHEKLEVGMIAVDAIYSPIKRVRYNVENTRVGQVTDLDRLVLEVETDGSISPQEAVTQAAEILVQHFAVVSGQSAPETSQSSLVIDDVTESNASRIMIEEVNFSPRTTNALMNNDIRTMKELLRLSNAELRELKGFGAKAYEEVKSKISELGLVRETEEA
ncbi:MAG TPA: DNA-directed RNA polymerase subunit alpha [Candidatus Polarisedimenticolaceae bacterium]|nr:DNA-directed RNA polymerase subunit alpha [Candidatus Polarisedimenticolaceae bacterium]